MRKFAFIPLLSLGLILFACSSHLWQSSREIKPITYKIREDRVKRTIGNLRHLMILPVHYEYNKDWFEPNFTPEQIEEIEQSVSTAAMNFLTDKKGYEVRVLDHRPDKVWREHNLSDKEFLEDVDVLSKWALYSADGEMPPENIVNTVARIGNATNVDGLILIQGHHRPSMIRADLFEVSSGGIVWRNKIGSGMYDLSRTARGLLDPHDAIRSLLGSVEPALPAVFESK
jgi:hypothetical protein